ncbi:hypothetical protein GWI33_012144 [Rhynchophorus ferrugineus]|uniref:Uncharacterized protein n=1 Tax=Rhynchophorus ferrugineus TaxID=354439 RepID=A0A834M909_RHYFE|nr:hypothetical protein GWI33_012144 [Rhynchophorus ferrugineus]
MKAKKICHLMNIIDVLKCKVLYNNHQRNLRFIEYKSRISDLDENMNKVEKIANETSLLLSTLENKIIKKFVPPIKLS